jgi:hypothetical protein
VTNGEEAWGIRVRKKTPMAFKREILRKIFGFMVEDKHWRIRLGGKMMWKMTYERWALIIGDK